MVTAHDTPPNRLWYAALGVLISAALLGIAWCMRFERPPIVDDTLVFLSPHPDDEAHAAAMTIAANVREGRRVVLVLMTDGEASKDADWWIEELGEDLDGDDDVDIWDFGLSRRAEFKAAAAAMGVTEMRFFGAAGSQGESGIRDGGLSVENVDAVVHRIGTEYPGATLATVMKSLQDDTYLGDVRPHDDHALLCDAVHAQALHVDEIAYFFKPYASLDAAWYRRSAPHHVRGDAELRHIRAEAVGAYQVIGRRSWRALYFTSLESGFEYMVTSEEF